MDTVHIMVYLDGSSAARRAVTYLAPLARHSHVKITLLIDRPHEAEAETLFCNAEALLNAANPPIRSIRGATAERAIVLESKASQPDLVVFGPLSRGGWQRWLGQSAVRSLARRLTTSILLMRGRPNELRRALLCTAGGREGIVDARMTATLLGPLHGQATVLHIVSQMPLMFNRDQRNPDFLAEVVMSENTRVNRNIAAVQTVLKEAGVDVKIRIRVGMVVEQIKEELQVGGYDLLVIGAHHARTPLDRVLLEDLSTELLLDSPIPVLVVQNAGE
ncbi:MAG: universal stress protein [Herpetosiphonaceae bacterium]|nr:universal stress protein [Herpetosiphonaceae bacterium]